MTSPRVAFVAFWFLLSGCTAAPRQRDEPPPITIAYRSTVLLAAAARDQHETPFTVAGLSGIAWLDDENFLAVMDNSDKIVKLRVKLAPDARIEAAVITGGLTVAENRDFEGIVYTGPARHSVLLAYEGLSTKPPATKIDDFPGIREYSLDDGRLLQALPTPLIFAWRRGNLAFESLGQSPDGRELWTANEEALTCDGPAASGSGPNTVRLVRYVRQGDTYAPVAQYAYDVEPWHQSPFGKTASPQHRSGLSDLVCLPDGRLLALERSFVYHGLLSSFETRIYEVDIHGATDVSSLTEGLAGKIYKPARKRLLWSGPLANLEGLCLGPRLPSGRGSLLGVTDNNGILPQTLVSFEIAGVFVTPARR